MRVHNARLRWAAVTIQKLVRKRIATGLLTRSYTAVILLQRVARKSGAQCRFSKIRAATNYLQACMRMWRRFENDPDADIIIPAAFPSAAPEAPPRQFPPSHQPA